MRIFFYISHRAAVFTRSPNGDRKSLRLLKQTGRSLSCAEASLKEPVSRTCGRNLHGKLAGVRTILPSHDSVPQGNPVAASIF